MATEPTEQSPMTAAEAAHFVRCIPEWNDPNVSKALLARACAAVVALAAERDAARKELAELAGNWSSTTTAAPP